ncbi:MAG TPA: D-2-hydroxyacid dehydrogenase [Chloroflexia bacterium]|jgi:phosphoglycerate dehydrogenase-like enzyme
MALEPYTPEDQGTDPASAASSQPVYVLIDHQLDAKYIEQIEAAAPNVRVLTTFPNTGVADPMRGDANARRFEGEQLDELLAQAEVLFAFGFPVEWVQKAPRLKWVQLASAGSDQMQRAGIFDLRPDLILTTSSGVHEVPISEHIVGMLLYFARRFQVAVRNQPTHTWQRYQASEAAGRTVCFVGYGPIARRAAFLCKTLGMNVLVVRASITEEQPGTEHVDRYYPGAMLNRALSQSDYIVVAAPRTSATEGMIGREQFAAMKAGAVLINISRGALVDEDAMIEALREGKLGGAGLDVFREEPLPPNSPLWDMPNVLVTPHVSGSSPHYNERATAIFADNLSRYTRGDPLRNRVIKERGY